jgi:preprotein translocase subunit SecE
MTLTIILFVMALIAFGVLWYTGQLKRFAVYVQATREELRKCSWPTWDELKESTVLVMVVTLLIGVFTVIVDFVFTVVAQRLV